MSGCALAALIVGGLFVVGILGIWLIAVLVLNETADQLEEVAAEHESAQREMDVIERETGIETDSTNLTNPPQLDLDGDAECALDGRPLVATGRLTNHSSETSDYWITVSFTEADGTRFDQGSAFVNQVGPDETVAWEAVATGTTDPREADVDSCRVAHINRFSSEFGLGLAEDYQDARAEMRQIEEETGIGTDSANVTNPPQHDLDGDAECALDGRPLVATGRLTNHSSETSDYWITVSFVEPDGTRFDQASTFVDQIGPDETARWEVTAFGPTDPDGAVVTCAVIHINRFSASGD